MTADLQVSTEREDVSGSEHLTELLQHGTLTIDNVEVRLTLLELEESPTPTDALWYSGVYYILIDGHICNTINPKGSLIQLCKAALEESLLTLAQQCVK